MSATSDKLVARYLKHLDVELDDLPRDRRREIVDEISGHIAEARADLEQETESDVRNILEGLGDPAEIATDARERFDVSPRVEAEPQRAGAVEIGALILLLVGGLILPVFGWMIGVVLLWVSNAWNVRDKIIGTLLVPGGLVLPLGFILFSVGSGSSGICDINLDTTKTGDTVSCPASSGGNGYLYVLLAVVALAPIVTTAYLAYRLRQNNRAVAIA